MIVEFPGAEKHEGGVVLQLDLLAERHRCRILQAVTKTSAGWLVTRGHSRDLMLGSSFAKYDITFLAPMVQFVRHVQLFPPFQQGTMAHTT